MGVVYLALYKGQAKGRWERCQDRLIRFFSRGRYSHCELAVKRVQPYGRQQVWFYDCYSASPRDGGVRCKSIDLENGKWELIPLDGVTETQIRRYFEQTQGAKYDWWGMLGLIFGIKQKRSKFFCSEWCFNAVTGSDEGWRFSPNQLAAMFKRSVI